MPCDSMNAFFLPNLRDIQATVGMTAKVVTRAPMLPNSVGQIHAAAVGLDANLDVVIDNTFDGYENFHSAALLVGAG